MFYKKGILKNFAKIIGRHLYQRLFLNKVADLTPAPLIKKRLWHRSFPAKFAKFLRTPFFIEHLRVTASESRNFNGWFYNLFEPGRVV